MNQPFYSYFGVKDFCGIFIMVKWSMSPGFDWLFLTVADEE